MKTSTNNSGKTGTTGREELCLVCVAVIAAIATVLVLAGGTGTAAFGGSLDGSLEASVEADDAARAAAWVRPGTSRSLPRGAPAKDALIPNPPAKAISASATARPPSLQS